MEQSLSAFFLLLFFGDKIDSPYIFGERRILFQKLHYTVCQLRMIHAQALGLVQWKQDASQKDLVLLLQRQRKSVDDGSENLEQFGDTIKSLGFVCKLEEDVVDRSADEGAEVEEFAVDAVECRLEEITLSGILRVEEVEELQHKAVIYVGFCYVRVEVLTFNEAKEEFIDDLDMRPCDLQNGLVLFRIESLALGVYGRGNRSEQVLGEHVDDPRVHGLSYHLPVVGDIVE